MDAVRYFPELLQEVTDLMVEKEIRLRTPLEELALLMDSVGNEELGTDENKETLPEDQKEQRCDHPHSANIASETASHEIRTESSSMSMDTSDIPLPEANS